MLQETTAIRLRRPSIRPGGRFARTAAVVAPVMLAVLFGGAAVGDSGRLAAQVRAPESDGSTARDFVLREGERFSEYRIAYEFDAPVKLRIRIAPRGMFRMLEAQPTEAPDLYVFSTTFRIRRLEELWDAAEAGFAPCKLPELPAGGDFLIEAQCADRIGQNALQREIRLERRGDLLHLLLLTWRSDRAELAERLRQSLTMNLAFYGPADPELRDPVLDPAE